jgi:hypothetical protein
MKTENAATQAEVIELPSGATATMKHSRFLGRHIREAQRIIGDNKEDMMFGLIAVLFKIDGQDVIYEEVLDDMDGADVLALMAKVGENFSSAAKK